MAERKVTVRVDLQAGGNLSQALDANKAKAQQLNQAVAAGKPGAGGVSGAGGASQVKVSAGSMLKENALIELNKGKEVLSKVMAGIGFAGVGIAAFVHGVDFLRDEFTNLGHAAARATDALRGMQEIRGALDSLAKGSPLTSAQFQRVIAPEQRAQLELAQRSRPEDVPTIVAAQLATARQQIPDQAGLGFAFSSIQAALQRTQQLGFFEVADRERVRQAAVTEGMERAGITNRPDQLALFTQLSAAGLELGGARITDEQIQNFTRILSGQAAGETAAARVLALQQIQQTGVPGVLTQPQQQVQPQFLASIGDFYDRMTLSLQGPSQVDLLQQILTEQQTLNATMNNIENAQPVPAGPS